jgi:hypothetical protein
MAANEKDWTPKLSTGVDYSKLDLTGEEGFLLTRLDGATNITHLTHLTGMSQGKIKRILGRLVEQGAVEAHAGGGAAAEAPTEKRPVQRSRTKKKGDEPKPEQQAPKEPADEPPEGLDDLVEAHGLDGPPTLVDEAPAKSEEADANARPGTKKRQPDQRRPPSSEELPPEDDLASDEALDDGDEDLFDDDEDVQDDDGNEVDDDLPPASHEDAPDDDDDDDDDDDEDNDDASADEEEEEAPEEDERGRTWRQIFEEDLHPLDTDDRVKRALTASGVTLCAFCFDPNPRVIASVVQNHKVGLQHARLVAEHHRVSTGLDHLARRTTFVRDRQVQRFLFRNPQLSDRLFRRLIQPKRMSDLYRLTTNRDTTDRVRTNARKAFRQKFTQGTAEERVTLIIKCEGRCLQLLIGLGIDGRTTSLLCARPIHSTLLVQNLARWPATPPPVLVHLGKQPIVKRSPMLKNLLLRHPNVPAQLKRQLK